MSPQRRLQEEIQENAQLNSATRELITSLKAICALINSEELVPNPKRAKGAKLLVTEALQMANDAIVKATGGAE